MVSIISKSQKQLTTTVVKELNTKKS